MMLHCDDFDCDSDADDDFIIVERGPVSTVRKALRTGFGDSDTAQWIAVKTSSTNRKFSRQPHDVVKEVRLLSSLSHENVVPLFSHTNDRTSRAMHLWMPFIPFSFDSLLNSPAFSPHSAPLLPVFPNFSIHLTESCLSSRFLVVAKSFTFQILSAIAYLHNPSQNIAHRDIKPRNALFTADGCVKLIDFGISWKSGETEEQQQHDLWPERSDDMCTAVSTGPYRAPELLFGPKSYNAFAADMWSLGTTLSELFTPLELVPSSSSSSSSPYPDHTSNSSSESESDQPSPSNDAFIVPRKARTTAVPSPDAEWNWLRNSLFDGTRGELGLLWSIFKTMGTPTDQTWPGFKDLAAGRSVTFNTVPAVQLDTRLPNLPRHPEAVRTRAIDLVSKLLVYPPESRLGAQDALSHPFLTCNEIPLLLPPAYPLRGGQEGRQVQVEWEGLSLGDLLRRVVALDENGELGDRQSEKDE
ncbi:hypothetical protein AX14_013616 [Amanita brunnescens Koide BX004]|nr:hypothetical protein AX14_013616 [Amanita brunnescens Koide BX004]